jgi:acyl-CoA thioesterase-1
MLVQMEAPPNLGTAYTSRFRAMYPDLARENGITLLPFLLEGVAGERALNQNDGIHPTAEGSRRVTANLWPALERELRAAAPPPAGH